MNCKAWEASVINCKHTSRYILKLKAWLFVIRDAQTSWALRKYRSQSYLCNSIHPSKTESKRSHSWNSPYLQCGYRPTLVCRALTAKHKLENILLSQMTVTHTTTQSLNSLLPRASCPSFLLVGSFQSLQLARGSRWRRKGITSIKLLLANKLETLSRPFH